MVAVEHEDHSCSRSEISCKANQVDPAPEARLLRDPVEMRPHGAGAYVESLSDLSVSEPLCNEVDHFSLATRQSVDDPTYRLAGFGDVWIVDGNKNEGVLATLNSVAALQRMLPHTAPVDDGAVPAAEIQQEPPSVSKLQFRVQRETLESLRMTTSLVASLPMEADTYSDSKARAVRQFETRHGEILNEPPRRRLAMHPRPVERKSRDAAPQSQVLPEKVTSRRACPKESRVTVWAIVPTEMGSHVSTGSPLEASRLTRCEDARVNSFPPSQYERKRRLTGVPARWAEGSVGWVSP